MTWAQRYPKSVRPGLEEIGVFIQNPLWGELRAHLEQTYGVLPVIEHSTCSGAPGWNVKYKKSGRSLCTLYPDEGAFMCLVSVGTKEAVEAELMMHTCTDYVQELFWRVKTYNGARWLMIRVADETVLRDVERLIALRMTKKK